jgi:predicted nucleotidyltransferase
MSLIQILKTKDARKIFGKKELLIIEKQLFGVSLTQSEKNRLSRDIRKKFEIIKRLSPFIEEINLKKGVEIKNLIEETKEIILNDILHNKIKRIILFGSTAENSLTLFSDIDIAVEFSDTNLNEATQFRIRIMGNTSKRIDVQVYNILPDKIKKEIDSKGKVIYEQNKR